MKQVSIFALKTEGVLGCPFYPIAPERWLKLQKIPNPEARARSLAGELLLCWAVRHMRPPLIPSPPLRRHTPYGKPYFAENPCFAFSLSHSHEWAVLAVSDAPLGIDLEVKQQNRPHIVSRYFHEQEKKDYFSLSEREQTDMFYKLWTLKESVVKSIGMGMHFPFSRFSVSLLPSLKISGLKTPAALFVLPFLESYCLSGCVLTEDSVSPSLRTLSLEEALYGE